MRDDRGFLVWEEALRLARGRDLGHFTGTFEHAGVVALPFPLPGMHRSAGRRGEVRSVRVPVWRPQPEGRAPGPDPVPPGATDSEVLVIEFDVKGVEASGLPYRLRYVHVVTVHDGHVAAAGEAVARASPGPRRRAADDERSKSVVRRCLEGWNAPGFDGIERLVAAGCVDHAHPGLTGPEASFATARRLLGTSPRPSFGIDTLVGDGDLVAARTTARQVLGGEAVVTSGMAFFHVIDGRIAQQWSCYPGES